MFFDILKSTNPFREVSKQSIYQNIDINAIVSKIATPVIKA